MKKAILILLLSVYAGCLWGQGTFKSGWNTYKTGVITHEYTYNIGFADSIKLSLSDSAEIFTSADSLVTMALHYPAQDKSVYKVSSYLNAKKQIVKKEEYRDDNLEILNEWKYDDKNRKCYHFEDNKPSGKSFRRTYGYSTDKKNGELVVTESTYSDGRIEFYTKAYYDRKGVKLKEVRLNDNNKDVVHIESYTYGENGKVKERTVYFPEWKVTKKFEEKEGNETPKCFRSMPVGTAEKISIAGRVAFMEKLLARNRNLLIDKDCHDYEYKFTNFNNCEIVVCTTNINSGKKVTFRYKEKL